MIARRVLKDVQRGMRLTAIARKYQPFHPFSRAWLRYAIAAGRLERMVRGLSVKGGIKGWQKRWQKPFESRHPIF